jgi:hypothetical protein
MFCFWLADVQGDDQELMVLHPDMELYVAAAGIPK